MQEWVKKELKHMDLKDERLVNRLGMLLEAFTEKPSSSIPKACGSPAETKAAYRFFENERVEADEIREGHFKATVERAKEHKTILAISDSTGLVYSSHKKLKGIGVLRNFQARGLVLHSCLLATPEEEVIGLVYQKDWRRKPEDYGKRALRAKLNIKDKESNVWPESFIQTQKYLEGHSHVIFVGDRGADMLALFNTPRGPNFDILVRACFNRRIENSKKKLFEYLEEAKLLGYKEIEVEHPETKKTRNVTLEIRSTSVTLSAKNRLKRNNLKSATMNAVVAKEVASSEPSDEKIYWRLLTTLPVENLEDAIQCIEYYKTRWLIERYHFVLKSGCKIQELQLNDAVKIGRALATYSIAAWRLMSITYLARVKPDSPCTIALEEDEWKALHCYVNKTKKVPKKPPTMAEALVQIARIGGFQARKADGPPGLKTVWVGLLALSYITDSYRLWGKKTLSKGVNMRCG